MTTRQLLRITTAGSVDDGKSTLIGRLLHDTDSLPLDHLEAVTDAEGVADLAALSDGLRAEREQGITIDVAYRYFATPKRAFLIADAPGHQQYTRNQAAAASQAELAVVLVSARDGVQPQTRRHMAIASLFGLKAVVFAVNKMDHPAARTMVEDVRSIVALEPDRARRPAILLTEALRGEGVPELWAALEQRRSELVERGELDARRERNLSGEVEALASGFERLRAFGFCLSSSAILSPNRL